MLLPRLVAVPHRQGLLLVAHRARAASGADGAAAAGPQPARRHDPRAVRRAAGGGARLDRAARPARRWRWRLPCWTRGAVAEPFFPAGSRQRAIDKAVAFVTERLNGEDGLGGIFPAMANSLMMFECLGYPRDHPAWATAASAIDKLVVHAHERSYCQPCLSPVWDTALACHALMEAGGAAARPADRPGASMARRKAGARRRRRLGDDPAGPAPRRLGLPIREPALPRCRRHCRGRAGARPFRSGALSLGDRPRAAEWILGMQSRNGGWGSFDADNTHDYLNHIPFADHGALLDPPTADVSARCLGLLGQLGCRAEHPAVAAAARLSAARAGGRRQLVRALGHQLHLRNLVGARRSQRRRHQSRSTGDPPRRRLAARPATRRRRLGRGRGIVLARQTAWRGALQHRFADRLGIARR